MQDRYASEAYSEDPPDAESARRLLEFGEDYRNDLDSLSDCPSLSLSTASPKNRYSSTSLLGPHKRSSPLKMTDHHHRSSLVHVEMTDSDSDMDDLLHLVETSTSQYNIATSTLHKVLSNCALEPSQYVSYPPKTPLSLVPSKKAYFAELERIN